MKVLALACRMARQRPSLAVMRQRPSPSYRNKARLGGISLIAHAACADVD